MPTYIFICPNCKTEEEIIAKITDDSQLECPGCGNKMRKKFFPAAVMIR